MIEPDGFRNEGERRGAAFLQSLGHCIVARNYFTPDRRTEIDLITVHQTVLHFVEVKAWRRGYTHPLESQRNQRQRRVRKGARAFIARLGGWKPHESAHIIELCPDGSTLFRIESLSFDLLWVRGEECEFFQQIF